MRVWTRAYNAFVMGGDVNQPICMDVDDTDVSEHLLEFPGHESIQVYAVNSHVTGETFYVDPVSGGLLGPDLGMIKDDIAEHYANGGTHEELVDQRLKQSEKGKTAAPVACEEFWERLARNAERNKR